MLSTVPIQYLINAALSLLCKPLLRAVLTLCLQKLCLSIFYLVTSQGKAEVHESMWKCTGNRSAKLTHSLLKTARWGICSPLPCKLVSWLNCQSWPSGDPYRVMGEICPWLGLLFCSLKMEGSSINSFHLQCEQCRIMDLNGVFIEFPPGSLLLSRKTHQRAL